MQGGAPLQIGLGRVAMGQKGKDAFLVAAAGGEHENVFAFGVGACGIAMGQKDSKGREVPVECRVEKGRASDGVDGLRVAQGQKGQDAVRVGVGGGEGEGGAPARGEASGVGSRCKGRAGAGGVAALDGVEEGFVGACVKARALGAWRWHNLLIFLIRLNHFSAK